MQGLFFVSFSTRFPSPPPEATRGGDGGGSEGGGDVGSGSAGGGSGGPSPEEGEGPSQIARQHGFQSPASGRRPL